MYICSLHTDIETDTMSSLDTKGSLEGDSSHYDNTSNVLPAKTTTQCCLHQYNLSSSSDLNDEILPLSRGSNYNKRILTCLIVIL